MNRRAFLSLLGAAGAAALCRPRVLASQASQPRPPNIILILADDLGYADLSCQGGLDVRTTNIDRLASEGVRCTDGYVSSSVCSPSRAGLLTGRYQQRFGHEFNPRVPRNQLRYAGLPLWEKTIADHLRSAGYATACVGKAHFGGGPNHHPLKRGFDEFFGFLASTHPYFAGEAGPGNPILRNDDPVEEREYLTDAFTREACAFIERRRNDRFFLYLAYNAVHGPVHNPPQQYLGPLLNIRDRARLRMAGTIAALDAGVGRVLATLARLHLDQDTLLFFLSDNGALVAPGRQRNAPFLGGKTQLWEGGIRVPFIVRWQDHLPAGRIYRSPVISLDLAATANCVAGIPRATAGMDGVNLLPHLTGERADAPHDALYWRSGHDRAIRCGDWKLVHADEHPPRLCNLPADPSESHNLYSQMPQVAADLEARYSLWNEQLVPPLWTAVGPERELPDPD